MRGFGRQRVLGRVVVMVIINIVIVIAGLVWFDFLGILDLKGVFGPVYRLVGMDARKPAAYPADRPTLLDDERYAKQLAAVESGRQELAERERAVAAAEAEVQRKLAELSERENTLADREKSFNETLKAYENIRANLEQNARYLTGMRPEKAVEILNAMDDQSVIDTLRMVEEIAQRDGTGSMVAEWLSRMKPERAAAIQRKMATKPTEG